jgi:hypothetical protein
MKGIVLLVMTLLPLPGLAETRIRLDNVGKPGVLAIDEENAYVGDVGCVKVIRLKDGKFVKQIGRPGQGPGEFVNEVYPRIINGVLHVSSDRKITTYDRKLELKSEVTFRKRYSLIWALGDRFVGEKLARRNGDWYMTFSLFTPDFKLESEIFNRVWGAIHANRTMEFLVQWGFESNGARVALVHPEGLKISLFSPEGKLVGLIDRPDKKIPFTAKDRNEVIDFWRITPPYRNDLERYMTRTVFPAFFPAIRECCMDARYLYVFTHHTSGEKSECLVFDLSGKWVATHGVRLYGGRFEYLILCVRDGFLYQVAEDESSGDWLLIKSALGGFKGG